MPKTMDAHCCVRYAKGEAPKWVTSTLKLNERFALPQNLVQLFFPDKAKVAHQILRCYACDPCRVCRDTIRDGRRLITNTTVYGSCTRHKRDVGGRCKPAYDIVSGASNTLPPTGVARCKQVIELHLLQYYKEPGRVDRP